MDLKLTEQQQMLADATRQFAEQRLLPQAEQADQEKVIPPEILSELASMGYCGIGTPEKYGGSDLDAVSYALMIAGAPVWDEDIGIPMNWWKWLLTAIWYCLLSVGIAAGFTLMGEKEPRAGYIIAVLSVVIMIILGLGLWLLL